MLKETLPTVKAFNAVLKTQALAAAAICPSLAWLDFFPQLLDADGHAVRASDVRFLEHSDARDGVGSGCCLCTPVLLFAVQP